MSSLEVSYETSFGDWLDIWYPDWFYLKYSPAIYGSIGWPDRFLFGPGARTVFIEWKREGKQPSTLQRYRHRQLRQKGYTVYVWDNLEEAKRAWGDYIRAEGLPDRSD